MKSRPRGSLCAILLLVWLAAWARPLPAQTPASRLAPGAPGGDAQWASAGKTAVGTSNTLESKVWFTLRAGVLTDVYYPTVDVANTQELQFVVVSADGRRVETEADDTTHRVEVLDAGALSFRQTNTARSGAYTLVKTYTTDPARSTLLVDVQFRARGGERLYVYYDPSLNNSGMHDSAWTEGGALLASDADKASALVLSLRPQQLARFAHSTNGYFQTASDGLKELRARGRLAQTYVRAADGNVVQVAKIPSGFQGRRASVEDESAPSAAQFTLALGFGREPQEALANARASLVKGFAAARAEYERGWHDYTSTLRRVTGKYQAQLQMAALVLKAHEDKTFRGAMIASLSVPWGGGASANEPNVGGYHLVWSRDLYQVATAFYALGDKASADRALDYLFRVQQKPDGSFPQNSWLDGRPFWGSLQLDEVAYPLILAYQLGRTDNQTWTKHVRPAADFLIRHGAHTPQERWEEESGYSPSTIAAEIAGLVCASEIARRNDDRASAEIYLAAADKWARSIESWTATTSGKYRDGNYYLRITENDDPNDGEPRELNNGAGTFDEREIVDAGFLELVRLGIKRADDPLVAKSVAVVDQIIRVETPNGASFYRYNHDGYGEMDDGRPWNFDGKYTGRGRLWALLAGERGEYELARGQREEARQRLDAMLGFANEGGMIPEQVWDKAASPRADLRFGEGTGSATPLAWSMAQFVRLAVSLEEGRNIMLPDVVAARYARQEGGAPPDAASASWDNVLIRMEAGSVYTMRGRLASPRARAYVMINDERREVAIDGEGNFKFDIPVAPAATRVVFVTIGENGATSFQRGTLQGITPADRQAEERAVQTPAFIQRLKEAKSSPLVEGDRVTFIYRGQARRVEVAGDFTSWSPGLFVMSEVAGTNLKYLTRTFARGAYVEYKLVADGQWMTDPLNPRKLDNGVGGENSFFAMEGYAGTALADMPRGEPEPKIETVELSSRSLGGRRKLQIYLPPDYQSSQARYPVLYLQDGSDYLRRGRAAQLADRLIRQKRVAPFIIVFVDPADRMREYWANDSFADFMANEVVTHVDTTYRTRPERDARALLGASLGGVISVWTALRHPEVFGRVGGQSSAFQIDQERVVRALMRLPENPSAGQRLRFYFDVGRLEPLLDVNRRVQVMLAAKGYPVTYREAEAGHNYTAWRDQLAEALTALWKE